MIWFSNNSSKSVDNFSVACDNYRLWDFIFQLLKACEPAHALTLFCPLLLEAVVRKYSVKKVF